MRKSGPQPVGEDRLTRLLDWIAPGTLMAFAAIAWHLWQPDGLADPVADVLRILTLAAPLGLGLVAAAPSSEVIVAARELGIEIKDLAAFYRLRRIGCVVFGHRGVLVPDRLRMISAHPVEGMAPTDLIRRAARMYATSGKAMVLWGLGVTEGAHGSNTVFGLIDLALMTGNVGRLGTGANPIPPVGSRKARSRRGARHWRS